MRCKNCGWPNKPNERVCMKCGSPLEAESNEGYGGAQGGSGGYDGRISKTVREDEIFGGVANSGYSREESDSQGDVNSKVCPKCGYPVRHDSEKCPNCRFQLNAPVREQRNESGSRERPANNDEKARRPTRMSSDGGSGKHRGTINPYMMNAEMDPTFVLKPLRRVNERHDLDELEYDGKEVILNRGNTEQSNSSITSRQQAVVTRVDGHWYIEDRSEQKTTFVQAAHKLELHDGDIILLGNRLFEFHE